MKAKFFFLKVQSIGPVENLARWIGPCRTYGPLASAPLALAQYCHTGSNLRIWALLKFNLHLQVGPRMWYYYRSEAGRPAGHPTISIFEHF